MKIKSKNIVIVAPPFIPVSKDSVAGIEQIVYTLGRALVEEGYNVNTLAREDSEVYGNLIPAGLKEMHSFQRAELEHFHQAMSYTSSVFRRFIRESHAMDIILDRCEGISLTASHEENGPPVICGLDMESEYFLHPLIFQEITEKMKQRKDCFAAVSNHIAQDYIKRLSLAKKSLENRMHVVNNGIITDNFQLSNKPEDYLLYLGRIRRVKSPHLAIRAAIETGHRIVVAGGNIPGTDDGQYQDNDYFEREIRPLLSPKVEWFGPANLSQKIELYRNAKAVLFPRQDPEPFGLVVLEAMACGTPVIAFNHAKGPAETILHGETGFLVDDYEQMLRAIDRISSIDRRKCYEHVRTNFDYKKMGERYSGLIEALL